MAGKRQHFIPQFLQMGFASHQSRGETFTWVYRKTGEPFNSNIINVGVEGRFYTEGSNTEADDLISAAEGPFSLLIQNLRAGISASLSDPKLPDLVAHLELRTRHLRQSLLQSGEFVVSRMLDLLADEEAFAAFLMRHFQKNPSILRERFAELLAESNLPEQWLQPLVDAVTPLVPAFIEAQKSRFSAVATKLRALLPQALRNAAKSGHIRALTKSLSFEARAERYRGLTYTFANWPATSLILGDSAILFKIDRPETRFRLFLDKDDSLTAVFLPLNPRTALVGARDPVRSLPSELREAIARCSLEYFIAADDSSENRVLAQRIGADALPLTTTELEAIVSDSFQP